MKTSSFKYLSPFIIYLLAFISFQSKGWLIALPLIYAWMMIPLLELFIKPDPKNMNETEEALAKADKTYDFILYLVVPLQFLSLFLFLRSMQTDTLNSYEIAGRLLVMGLLCGVFGINAGHELGHRVNKFEQRLAKALLLSSLYMHFFIEHNKGHHKRVATPEDPSSARLGEWVYAFYFRSIVFSYISAWHIANKELRKKGLPVISLQNEMIQFHVIQFALIGLIFYFFGWLVCIYFIASAGTGILLLETVNYIEHYGLQRKQTMDGNYERALPIHSWNSNHIIGRLMLFELSRHSDHHYLASRKYQLLRHFDDSPQMPTGYPGMMMLALIPPAWLYVMNRKIKKGTF